MNQNSVAPDRILEVATGAWATGVLGAAASHSLFTHLEAGEDTADKLAKRAEISERGAQTLLDGLLSLGLIELRGGGYRNTAEASAFLVEGQPSYLGGFARVMLAQARDWSAFADIVRAGAPIDANADDVAFFEQLVPAIAPITAPVARYVAQLLGIAQAGAISVLDVGGGSGVYSAIMLAENPRARCTQLDSGPVNAVARRLLAEQGVADRFECIDGDMHTTPFGQAAYDVGIYSHVAHEEGAEQNAAILAKFRAALKPGAPLVISDLVVDDDRSGPPFPLLFAATMLLRSKHGTTWRRADYEAWLKQAGFTELAFHATPSPTTVIIAR